MWMRVGCGVLVCLRTVSPTPCAAEKSAEVCVHGATELFLAASGRGVRGGRGVLELCLGLGLGIAWSPAHPVKLGQHVQARIKERILPDPSFPITR